jgi:hypothetical protein
VAGGSFGERDAVGIHREQLHVDPTNHNIIGTTEDDLYQDLRKDAGGYRFPNVPNGTYQVELLFAEFENIRPNRRVFDVYIENQLVPPAFDPINDGGDGWRTRSNISWPSPMGR